MNSKVKAKPTKIREKQVGKNLSQADWAHVLQALYVELRSIKQNTNILSHEHVTEYLPIYISAGQSGENASKTFPAFYRHIQTCPQCRALYEQVKEAMQDDGPWKKSDAPFAQPHSERPLPETRLWEIVSPAKSITGSVKIKVVFQTLHTGNLAMQVPAVRGRDGVAETLLFSDQITLDNKSLLVQAWLVPDAKRENRAMVRVMMHGPAAHTRDGRAVLVWGKHRYAAAFKQGQVRLEHIDAADLDAPVSLTLNFPSHERPRKHSPSRPKTRARKRATTQRASQKPKSGT